MRVRVCVCVGVCARQNKCRCVRVYALVCDMNGSSGSGNAIVAVVIATLTKISCSSKRRWLMVNNFRKV